MSLKKREFTTEFKLKVVHEVDAGKPQAHAAREYHLNPNTLAKWRKQYRQYKEQAFAGKGKAYTEPKEVDSQIRLLAPPRTSAGSEQSHRQAKAVS